MKRNASLDIIRGFAVVLVACLHSIGNGSLTANHISGVSGYLLTGLWLLSASCVPLFLMLSGYLQNRKMPTVKYYVNYLHIYIPYLLLGVISLTVGGLYTHQSLSARDFVSSLVNFYTCEYSWFVMMYTGLVLLIPFLNAMYNGLETKGQKQVLILVFFALSHLPSLLNNPAPALQANAERWEGYLTKILRKDMKPEYDRIAVKAVTTLISNWRTHRLKMSPHCSADLIRS